MTPLEIIQAIQIVVQIITAIHTALAEDKDFQAVKAKLKANIGDFNDKAMSSIEKVYNDMKAGNKVLPSEVLATLEKADILNLLNK